MSSSTSIRSSLLALLCIALAAGCSKKEEPAGEQAAEQAATTEPAAEPADTPAEEPEPAGEPAGEPAADYVRIVASHAQPKPSDPVVVQLSGFEVTEATYNDPDDLSGGSAVVTLQLDSLGTDSEKRDAHLESEAYLDTANNTAATIKIDNVKKKAGDTYTATATVEAMGKTVERDVEFEVVEKTDAGVRIQARHEFPRKAFGIGKSAAEGDAVADNVVLELELDVPKPS